MNIKRLVLVIVALAIIIVAIAIAHRSAYAPADVETVPVVSYSGGADRDVIRLDSLAAGDEISSPLEISGRARGTWYFEASFPVSVVDWDGLIIGEGYATAQGDWMTEEFVPFTATVEFAPRERIAPGTYNARGAVILHNANASGEPKRDMAIEIPIVFRK